MAPSREHLEALTSTDVTEAIPPETYLPVLTSAPFIPTTSIINLRDAGAVPGSNLPSARFYRSGMLAAAVNDQQALDWLGGNVKRIFDLRTPQERLIYPDPEVEGIENIWYEEQGKYPDPNVGDFAAEGGRKAWKELFMCVTESYRPVFRAVLEHIRDRPAEPILFHCTAGRDRTGLLAGLLQTLAGSPKDAIILDYMLSRVGTEPARDKLKAFAMKGSGAESEEAPGFKEMCDLSPRYFEALEEGMEENYGGWEGYVTSDDGLSLSKEDLEQVKRNLRS
ncbi:hypothetical protein CC79DRAFT_1337521 [Sarocladium strictum]